MDMLTPDCKFPFLVFDNVLSEDQLKNVLAEIKVLNSKLDPPEKTGTARDAHGRILKSNNGAWMDDVYANCYYSHICTSMQNFYRPEVLNEIINYDTAFIHLKHDYLKTGTLLSKYVEGDYYEMHNDGALFTSCLWVWDEPKKFEGGEFFFHFDYGEEEVETKNNRLVIFPSVYMHSVKPVYGKGERYTISVFTSLIHRQE